MRYILISKKNIFSNERRAREECQSSTTMIKAAKNPTEKKNTKNCISQCPSNQKEKKKTTNYGKQMPNERALFAFSRPKGKQLNCLHKSMS